jgi:tagatose 6-phosphate kinase
MSILVVCLSPALQHTLWFKRLNKNSVNRAVRVEVSAGGKGINVARNLVQLENPGHLLTLLGGHTGEIVKDCLKRDEINYCAVSTEHNTRICMTLLEGEDSQTEIVEESGAANDRIVHNTEQYFKSLLPNSQFVILSGTVPEGFSENIYRTMSELAARYKIPVLVDGAGPLLRSTLPAKPFMVKPNKRELEYTLSQKIESEAELFKAMAQLFTEGAQSILVTDSTPISFLLAGGIYYKITAPRLQVINPIGSGDAIAAGYALKIIQGEMELKAARFAIACGTANVLTELAGHIEKNAVERIYKQVKIEKILN